MLSPTMETIPGGRYQPLRVIRKTLFGKVVMAVDTSSNHHHNNNGQLVAVKLSNTRLVHTKTSFSGEPLLEDPREEIRLMKKLSADGGHPGVLQLIHHINEDQYQWTVLEYCSGGEFFDLIANGGRLPPSQAGRYFRQVCEAVHFLHSRNVAHLDLSLENLLLDGNDHIKICDFGMAREMKTKPKESPRHYSSPPESPAVTPRAHSPSSPSLADSLMTPPPDLTREDEDDYEAELLSGKPGKIGYMSSEVYEGKPFDGRLADVWSCGIMLFMMLTGIPPWKVPANTDERYRLIMAGQLSKLLHAWNTPIPSAAMDLLSHMLCPVEKRWSMKQVLAHPFLSSHLSSSSSSPSLHLRPLEAVNGGNSLVNVIVPTSPSSATSAAA